MFLHLGKSTVIVAEDVVGIFDIETTTVSSRTRQFLADAEKNGKVINVSTELPKSFVILKNGFVYISRLSPQTLEARL